MKWRYFRAVEMGDSRPCRKCGVYFSGRKCRPCANEQGRAYRSKNPDVALAYRQRKKDELAAAKVLWAKQNKDKVRESRKRSYERNREEIAAKRALSKESDPERFRLIYGRANQKSRNDTLPDGYVAASLGVRLGDIPNQVIELQRIRLKIKRELRKSQ